jgi:hypothetical protein
MKIIALVIIVLVAPATLSQAAVSVDLYQPVTSFLSGVGGEWNVTFVPLQNMDVTGLGIVFDPTIEPVTPSLFVSLWQDNATTSNDNRIALMEIGLSTSDDVGLNHYLFKLADHPDLNPSPFVELDAGRTYVLLVQVNIDGQWPLQLNSQTIPFTTADGNFLVTGGGPGTAMSFPNFPPLFIEASPAAPEPSSLLTWTLLGIVGAGTSVKRRISA